MDDKKGTEKIHEALAKLDSSYKTRMSSLAQMHPEWVEKETDNGPYTMLTNIEVGGEKFKVTDRFLQSIYTRFGIGKSVFTIADPQEVFDRLTQRHPLAGNFVLTTVEGKALAVSNPNVPRVSPRMLGRLLQMPGVGTVETLDINQMVNPRAGRAAHSLRLSEEGVIQTTHSIPQPPTMIGGEGFFSQFLFETPIDGYGVPVGYISLLRLVCMNGMTGYRPAFRSIFKIAGNTEDQVIESLHRVVGSFTNEEGFAAIIERINKAQITAPSIAEVAAFRGLLVQELNSTEIIEATLNLLDQKMGSITHMYSVATVHDLDPKKARLLPMRGTLADLINIGTELTSHYPNRLRDPNRIHAWIGSLISESYDLEDLTDVGEPKGDTSARPLYLEGIMKKSGAVRVDV